MSMLAEPRRKQKVINLRAKNSAWSNDSNKFGQRMLEKMGWSSGKGLGAKENGIVEHVVARYKNDEKGLGFEDRNDQWTKHEDDFNALLANLSNGDSKEEKLHSGVSLEDKSKKSKARVHYHKFTRGKDLTRYSEKDLANIFGKKSLKNVEEKPDLVKEDIITTEQVFTEKGSMEDYFNSKLSALKTKVLFTDHRNDEMDYCFHGFAGTQDDNEKLNSNAGFQEFSINNNDTEEIEEKPKKKKKKDTVETVEYCEEKNELCEIEDKPIKKKKSKNKLKVPIIEQSEIPNILFSDTGDEALQKKSKKKKKKSIENIATNEQNELPEEENYVPKKKKKRKNKHNEL